MKLIPKKQRGGGLDINSVKKQTLDYINSDMYQNRLSSMRDTLLPVTTTDIKNRINSSNIVMTTHDGSRAWDPSRSQSRIDIDRKYGYPDMGLKKDVWNINIDPKSDQASQDYYRKEGKPQLAKATSSLNSTLAHELSHVQRELSYKENLLFDSLKNNSRVDVHDGRADEQKADLDALRYLMKKNNIYDTSKRDMDLQDFNKAQSDKEISNSLYFKRLTELFKPNDIIQLNNKVASTLKPRNTINNYI